MTCTCGKPVLAKSMCSACYMRSRRAANPEHETTVRQKWQNVNRKRLAEQARARYQTNPALGAAKARAWRRAHPEKAKLAVYKWSRANLDKIVAKNRRWIVKNPEKHRADVLAWQKANSDKRVAISQNYLARKRENGGSFTALEWVTLKERYQHVCIGCMKSERELHALGRKLVPDHVIPVSIGGSNDITNIQPLCHGKGSCNNKKYNREYDYRVYFEENL